MAELKKIAQVMRRFVPDKWGGTESVVFNVSRELQRLGIESPIFCTAMFSKPGRQKVAKIIIHRFRYVFPWFGLSVAAKDQLRLKGGSPLSLSLFFGLLKEKHLSLIHTHVQHRLGGMARTVARLKGVPLVVSIHGGFFTIPSEQITQMTKPFLGKPEWGKIFGFMFGARRVLQDADAIICVGVDEYEQVSRHYPMTPVFQVPNGVDVDHFASADGTAFRVAYGYQPSEPLVLCVARIDYQKNQLGLVRAFAQFVKTHPDHRLVLIGAVTVEVYYQDLLREIEQVGLGHAVRIIPGLEPDNPLLAGAYNAAQFFMMVPHHEPFGIVILEAWAAGLPVIAYAVGGISGFCRDRENALLVEPDNELQLVECMTELADHAELRTALRAKAFQDVSVGYNWPVIVGKYRRIYQQLLDSRS